MKTVGNIIPFFIKELSLCFEEREVINWAFLSFLHLLGYNRSDCIINTNIILDNQTSFKLQEIVANLKTNKPIQYILGETTFYGLKIKVNKHTLIPRPETEELVDWILKEKFNSALDIGTGSGCISIALAKFSKARISAIDISKNALKVAKENAILNETKVIYNHQDIFKEINLPKVDLIVSNPPYVLNSTKEKIQENILQYEPHSALFVSDNNPLIFNRRIIDISSKLLNHRGYLFFEINEQFANELIEILMLKNFVDIELKKDINDKNRMIKAIWK